MYVTFLEHICPKENFVCANGKCLDAGLICNGYDECGDNSDESTVCSGDIKPTTIIIRQILKPVYYYKTLQI